MPVLKKLLIGLSPIGDQFYDHYIYGNYQGIQFKFVVDNFTEYCTTLTTPYIQKIIA